MSSPPNRLYWKLPLLLYVLTWLTTTGLRLDDAVIDLLFKGLWAFFDGDTSPGIRDLLWTTLRDGLAFSIPLMLILTCHELGHYIQTRRYGIPSSLPYFIPLPLGPIGTLGAVIAMDGRIPNRRALFDIGISGPLAGLIPTLFCLYFGIKWSQLTPMVGAELYRFGEPLIFQWMIHWIYGPIPPDVYLVLHPVAKAGWVGLFLTSLNMLPLGQLDGGHVFYALLGRRAAKLSWLVYYALILYVLYNQHWNWILILFLLLLIGVSHPPTSDDSIPLTPLRRLLGVGMLAFVLIGLTPSPIIMNEPPESPNQRPVYYCMAERQRM